MKLLTKIFPVFIAISICSCTSFQYVEIPTTGNILSVYDNGLASRIDKNEIFLVAVNHFNGERIKIFENDIVKHDTIISNKNSLIANAFKVNKESVIKIYLENYKNPIVLNQKRMEMYKFVYIYKRNRKVVIEFDNSKTVNNNTRTTKEYKNLK